MRHLYLEARGLSSLPGLFSKKLPGYPQLEESARARCFRRAYRWLATFSLVISIGTTLSASSKKALAGELTYPIVDTNQKQCFDTTRPIPCPAAGHPFHGQDAQHDGFQPSYRDNHDGTVSDNVTGLMWQKSPDVNGDGVINVQDKLTFEQAIRYCEELSLAGYDDWRLPDIKTLYSLIDFSGVDPSGPPELVKGQLKPFLDTRYFDFAYGDTAAGERLIDAQFVSATRYLAQLPIPGGRLVFGVNFADGRIKGYPLRMPGGRPKLFYVLCVRGNPSYGVNQFVDNGDGTITDTATGLMWARADSQKPMDWPDALKWVQQINQQKYLGYSDWRLPNAKELQSLVDYKRSPETVIPAISELFQASTITNEAGASDFPYYWTSTTHIHFGPRPGSNAV